MTEQPDTVTYTLTEPEFVAAQILFARSYKNPSFLWTVLACAVVLSLVEAGAHGFGALHLPYLVAIFLAELVTLILILWTYQRFARTALLPRQARRAYHKNADMKSERTLVWDAENFTSRTTYGRATLPWREIVNVIEDRTNLLLFASKTEFLIVPQRALSQANREALLSHLPVSSDKNARFM